MYSDSDDSPSFDPDQLVNECQEMMSRYWQQNPDLHEIVEEKKETARIIAKLWEGGHCCRNGASAIIASLC